MGARWSPGINFMFFQLGPGIHFLLFGVRVWFWGCVGRQESIYVFLLVPGIDFMVLRVRVRVWGARWASGVNSRVLHLGLRIKIMFLWG